MQTEYYYCDFKSEDGWALSCSDKKTHYFSSSSGSLISSNCPFYLRPLQEIPFFILSDWRNSNPSPIRCVTFGLALLGLAIVGVIDAVVRLTMALFVVAFDPSLAKTLYHGAKEGLALALCALTLYQYENIFNEKVFFDFKSVKKL